MAGLLWLRWLHAERATAAEEAQVPGFARSGSALTAVRVRASVYSRIRMCGAAGASAARVGAVLSTAGAGDGGKGPRPGRGPGVCGRCEARLRGPGSPRRPAASGSPALYPS